MERNIGEIFEYNGEWYQVVECDSCGECSLFTTECGSGTKSDLADEVFGQCSKVRRSDNKHAIFKKLEKVGEPFYSKYFGKFYQMYRTYIPPVGSNFKIRVTPVEYVGRNEIFIEIKQNQKDMEEKKIQHYDCFFDRKPSKSNLKPFSLELSKQGKPVCTRGGRKARIICFDKKGKFPIIALIDEGDIEIHCYYGDDGKCADCTSDNDLMMLSEKKEGWINVYALNTCYPSKEEAEANIDKDYEDEYLRTVKIEWED